MKIKTVLARYIDLIEAVCIANYNYIRVETALIAEVEREALSLAVWEDVYDGFESEPIDCEMLAMIKKF